MRPKFKNVALKIIQDALNDTYNYMALPDKVWVEKRLEYVSQYQMGVKYPKLTPITLVFIYSSTKSYYKIIYK